MGIVSIDFETDLIDRGKMAPAPVCMSEAGLETPSLFLADPALNRLEDLLASDHTIIGTNIAFDMAVAGQARPSMLPAIFAKYDRGQIQDVALNQKLLDIAATGGADGAYSLEELCARWGLPKPDKDGPWRLEFGRLRGVPLAYWPDGAIDYVMQDATLPLQIWDKQQAFDAKWTERTGSSVLALAGYEARKAFSLFLISAWGVHTDPARAAAFRDNLVQHLEKGQALLLAEGLVRQDGTRDTKAAQARMVGLSGANHRTTDTGGVCLDKDACAETGDPVMVAYAEYGQQKTLLARAEDLLLGVHYPLQTRFNSLLETGRTSTSKPKPPLIGVQAQNFPRVAGARETLEPRKGCVFVVADLPNAELRSLGQVNLDLFGAAVMADLLNQGQDLHIWFGSKIIGMPYEEALARAKDPVIKKARNNAKPCNFGFPGGMGAENFMNFAAATYKVIFTLDEAEHLKKVWLQAFPEMAEYFKHINKLLKGRDRALMRHLRSGRWRGRVTYCQACNSNFQELTATASADALCEVQRRNYTDRSSALFESRTLLYTHDEIVLETPEDMAQDAGMELSTVYADYFTRWHPDVPALPCTGPGSDARVIYPAISRIYSKGVEARWDDKGHLALWEAA